MTDQAASLRQAVGSAPASTGIPPLPALAVTGGKGGVGKTCLAVNISLQLARLGTDPLLVDLDMGLANADVLLGVNPASTLFEVVVGGRPLREALVLTPQGLAFIPAASGREELTRLSHRQFDALFRQLQLMNRRLSPLVFDTMAGISAEVTQFLRASKVIVNVITPDPTSLTDSYALIKVLESQSPGKDIRVVVNQAGSDDEGHTTFARLRKVVQTYLKRDVEFLGSVPRDRHVIEAVRSRCPFITKDCPAAHAVRALAMRLKAVDWRP